MPVDDGRHRRGSDGEIKIAGIDNITFAWAGRSSAGRRHYYRVQGPTFLIEFDNTQNDGNHVHSVWRDFKGDFGRDLLREHLRTSRAKHLRNSQVQLRKRSQRRWEAGLGLGVCPRELNQCYSNDLAGTLCSSGALAASRRRR